MAPKRKQRLLEKVDEIGRMDKNKEGGCGQPFVILDLYNWCPLEKRGINEALPCEIAAVRVDLEWGILQEFHRLVHPPEEDIYGKKSEILRLSEKWHKLKLPEKRESEPDRFVQDFRQVALDLLDFITDDDALYMPMVFILPEHEDRIKCGLSWLFDVAECGESIDESIHFAHLSALAFSICRNHVE